MPRLVTNFLSDEKGSTAIEYGLMAAIIGVGIIGGLTSFGDGLMGMYENIAAAVEF
jgi:pilus assembly protein Flp/PilA